MSNDTKGWIETLAVLWEEALVFVSDGRAQLPKNLVLVAQAGREAIMTFMEPDGTVEVEVELLFQLQHTTMFPPHSHFVAGTAWIVRCLKQLQAGEVRDANVSGREGIAQLIALFALFGVPKEYVEGKFTENIERYRDHIDRLTAEVDHAPITELRRRGAGRTTEVVARGESTDGTGGQAAGGGVRTAPPNPDDVEDDSGAGG